MVLPVPYLCWVIIARTINAKWRNSVLVEESWRGKDGLICLCDIC